MNKRLKFLLAASLSCIALIVSAVPALAADPTIVTGVATDTTDNTTTLSGNITSFGTYGGTYVYLSFDYANEGYYNGHGSTYDKHTSEISWKVADGLTAFTTTVTGLSNSTDYHYRAKIRFGSDYAYGLDTTVTTTMMEPDQIPRIYFFKAYQDLLEANDCLFVIMADIPYSTVPNIPVSRAFIWSLMDTGNEVGWNVGYAMNDNGYNFNVYSLYFAAASAIDWGNDTDYELVLSGSPDVFKVVIPSYGVVDSGDYSVMSDTWVTSSDYKVKLGEDLLDIAKQLEEEWQVVLLDEQDTKTVLSSNGEKLFRNAIPNVQMMAPAIFFVQAGDTDTSARAWTTNLGDTYKERLLGADGLPGGGDDNFLVWGLVGIADWLNMPFLLVIGICVLGLCVLVIKKSQDKWQTSVPGYIGSLIIIMCATLLVLGFTVIALIGLFLTIIAGWLLFMRRA